ncbi:MAG: alpha/beta hydrolase, partial [Terriglobia bacterium]
VLLRSFEGYAGIERRGLRQPSMKRLVSLLAVAPALTLALALCAQTPDALTPLGIGLETYPYPYPVHFIPLAIQGQDLRMAYMDVAPTVPANGRSVVLMHGKNFGGYYFVNLIRALTGAGFRVIVPDQIGWGRSSKPDIRYSFHLLAANTAHLLDVLQIPAAAVLGHSTGGMLAVRFALLYPERTERLILEDPLGLEDYRIGPPQTDEELYQNELNATPDKVTAVFQHYFVKAGPEVWKPLAEVPLRVLLSGEYPRWAKASALAYQMIYQQPVRSEYHLLKPATLLVVGDQDHTAPMSPKASAEVRAQLGHIVDRAREAVKDIPRASLVVVPDCGHIPHIEYPDLFNKTLLTFLNSR